MDIKLPAEADSEQRMSMFESSVEWHAGRPRVLVIACSDGRLQLSVDDFLHEHLGITDYDRLFAPGGPGALTPVGPEPQRAAQFLEELRFLVRVHTIERVVLVFHSAAEGGPEDAVCGDYRRLRPQSSQRDVAAQQESDLSAVIDLLDRTFANVSKEAYRAEVTEAHHVRFVNMLKSLSHFADYKLQDSVRG